MYPWLLLVPFLTRRSWDVLVGAAIGAAAAIGIAATVIPLRYFAQFFFEILPRLGGMSLSYENLSAAATVARAVLIVTNQLPSPRELDVMYLEEPQLGNVRVTTILVVVAAAAAVGWRGWRRGWWRVFDSARQDVSSPLIALLAISVCAMVALIPTSWMSYQMLLVFPALYGVAYTGTADRVTVILLVASLASGTMLHSYSNAFATHPGMFASARTLIPFALAVVVLRIRLRMYRQLNTQPVDESRPATPPG